MSNIRFLTLLLLWFPTFSIWGASPDAPTRCRILDYHSNLGIDTDTPRFAWEVNDTDQRECQTAFEIILADTEEEIRINRGNYWCTRRIQSDDQEKIYSGKPLQSATGYWWKVRSWDKDGQVSPWSETNFFLTGFLRQADWSPEARWISAPQPRVGLAGAWWIWKEAEGLSPVVQFRSELDIPSGKTLHTAQTTITADSAFTLTVNDKPVIGNSRWTNVTDIDLAPYLKTGKNSLHIQAVRSTSPKLKGGLIARTEIRYTDGELDVRVTDGQNWETTGDDTNWKPAIPVARFGREPWFLRHSNTLTANDRTPLFRKEFSIKKRVRKAWLFISGLGVFDATLNASKIGDQLIPPAWTDYDKTVNYVTFDVTQMLKEGQNVLGVMLGNGWFDYQTESTVKRHGLGETAPHIRNYGIMRLKAQMNICYEDGTNAVIVSDPSWKTSAGPYRLTHVFGSEEYDARLAQKGWNLAGFSDDTWTNAQLIEAPLGKPESQKVPPVTEQATYPAVLVNKPTPGTRVYDIGQNINGQYEINVSGSAGTVIKIVPGELLNNGRVKPIAHQYPTYSTYTLNGDSVETWRLTFSTAGFRYLEISEVPGDSTSKTETDIHQVTGYFAYSDAPKTGNFTSSDTRYNRIYDMVLKTLQSNLVTIHTDCPTYEKLGWLEVLTNTAPSYAYLFDMQSFWAGQIRNISDGQRANGLVPNIIPDYTHGRSDYDDSPAWGTATFVIPWLQYCIYGDTSVLTSNYPVMEKYLAYLTSREDQRGLLSHGLGDWMATAGNQQKNVENAIYLQNIRLMQQISGIIKKTTEQAHWSGEFRRVRDAYNNSFFNREKGCYLPLTQVNQALPLTFGIVTDKDWPLVFRSLTKIIECPAEVSEKEGKFGPILPLHSTIGDVGATYLWRTLGDGDESPLVETMILQPESPSYYHYVLKGMTTMPEHWLVESSRSMNHDMYGGIMEWFYRSVGGIQHTASGYKSFILKPAFNLKLEQANCSYHSPRGMIVSDWSKQKDKINWKIKIPVNTTAHVYIPKTDRDKIKANGKNIHQIKEIRYLNKEEKYLIYEIGSGDYDLVFPR